MDATYKEIYTNIDIARECLTDYFLKMIGKEYISKRIIGVGCIVGLGLMYTPLIGLLFSLVESEHLSYQGILTSQRIHLFFKSFFMTMGSSICSTVISTCMCITLVFTQTGKRIEKIRSKFNAVIIASPVPSTWTCME